jgi:hypothetical protein
VRRWNGLPSGHLWRCRGVAQPGRAPGSGPGGRRFKSSLPDHLLQSDVRPFWFFGYNSVDDFVTAKYSSVLKVVSRSHLPYNLRSSRLLMENSTRADLYPAQKESAGHFSVLESVFLFAEPFDSPRRWVSEAQRGIANLVLHSVQICWSVHEVC